MTYDFSLWFFEGKVITEVTNSKDEGFDLQPQKGEKEKKIFWKISLPMQEIEGPKG